MLFTLSTDPEVSLHTEHTESRRLRLADSWAPKTLFLFPFQNFPGASGSAIWHDSTRTGYSEIQLYEFVKITYSTELGARSKVLSPKWLQCSSHSTAWKLCPEHTNKVVGIKREVRPQNCTTNRAWNHQIHKGSSSWEIAQKMTIIIVCKSGNLEISGAWRTTANLVSLVVLFTKLIILMLSHISL